MVPKTPGASLVPRGGAWRFGGVRFFGILQHDASFLVAMDPHVISYINNMCIYIYIQIIWTLVEDLRDQPYMFSNIAALGTENPCLSFSLFRQWFHPVNPKGEAASPDSLDSHGMNLLMAGHSSLDDSKRKITSSARIGFNLSEPSLTTFQIQALSSNLMKTSLVFYGGYHHPTPVDMANKRLKNPIQSMISVRNHRKHIISPTKHWGGSSKFHHPKHWRTSGVVHHQIRLKPQNHKIPLNSACEVVEHGICINLSTRFLCRHNLHHLLGDLGISFLKIIRFSNPQQRHGEPW